MFLLQIDYSVNMLSELLKQGPAIGLMAFAVIYLYRKVKELDTKVEASREKLEKYLYEDRPAMMKVMQNSTTVTQSIERHLDRLQKLMEEIKKK